MKVNSKSNSGSYLLYINFLLSCSLRVGALGDHFFRSGYYIYVGRAKKNLQQRIDRHLRRRKKIHWHIDYLLEAAEIVDVLFTETLDECLIARKLSSLHEARVINRFGASDCRCPGHLIGLAERIPAEELVRRFSSLVLTQPLDWRRELR